MVGVYRMTRGVFLSDHSVALGNCLAYLPTALVISVAGVSKRSVGKARNVCPVKYRVADLASVKIRPATFPYGPSKWGHTRGKQ
jgi:hypothetical protein